LGERRGRTQADKGKCDDAAQQLMHDARQSETDVDMRITIAIDDDVLAAARTLAAQQRTSLGEVISDLARQSFGSGSRSGRIRNGVPLLPTPPRKPVTPKLIARLRDELSS